MPFFPILLRKYNQNFHLLFLFFLLILIYSFLKHKKGINVNPKKSQTEFIEWKNIKGFSELKIQSQKLVIIDVDNSEYWIENEENGIRKRLMKFNVSNYGSPFNLSANSMQMNYAELMKTLNENLNKYKYNA